MNTLGKLISTIAVFTSSTLALAIDTDIYVNNSSSSAAPPNVLLMFDNSGNWTANSNGVTKQTIEHEALFKFVHYVYEKNFDDDVTNDILMNLAIMGSTHSNGPGGGKPLMGFLPFGHETDLFTDPIYPYFHIKKLLFCGKIEELGDDCATVLQSGAASWADLETYVNSKALTDNNKKKFYSGSLPTANNAKYALQMYEAYNYFGDREPYSGRADANQTDGEPSPFALSTHSLYIDYPLEITNGYESGGTTAWSGLAYNDDETYRFPYNESEVKAEQDLNPDAEYCAQNHIIMIGNGGPDSGENNTAEDILDDIIEGTPTIFDLGQYDNYESNWADEFAEYMNKNDVNDNLRGDQTVETRVISVYDSYNNNPDKSAKAFMTSIVNRGSGDTLVTTTNVDELVQTLVDTFEEIQAVNDVFAASALPVSVNVRGTNLNQIYIGVFRPDADNRPRWFGNMKMYQLGYDDVSKTQLEDADGARASGSAGFIDAKARSFWTHDSTYWSYNPTGQGGENDNPDGDLVEKGGAAQRLRDVIEDAGSVRKVYTCTDGSCNSATPLKAFNTANADITDALLNVDSAVATDPGRDDLINWVRGEDIQNEHSDDSKTIVARPSVHGDVLHSRPAVINYGDLDNDPATEDEVFVFYGANDGMLHAIRGGKNNTEAGDPVWSFVAPEHYSDLRDLYDNAIMTSQAEKPFFVDGTIGALVEDNGVKATKVHIFATMRRGGKFIYALDVTDPADPSIIWKKSRGDTGYEEMGETWSAPIVSKISIDTDADGIREDKHVLIFGLGYDAAANDGEVGGNAAAEGRGIAIVDAADGSVIWQAGNNSTKSGLNDYFYDEDLAYAVPANVTVLDRDRNGYADRVYFGDTGGQLFRADIFSGDKANWQINKLFETNGDQKFLSAPDVASASNTSFPADVVVISTGDRENPFETSVTDYIVAVRDPQTSVTNSTLTPRTLDADNPLANATTDDYDTYKTSAAFANGWFIQLEPAERGISKPTIVNGIAFMNTFIPTLETDSCSPSLGTARSYQIDFRTAQAANDTDHDNLYENEERFQEVPGGGLIPDPVAVIVDIGGQLHEAIISGTQVQQFPNTQLERREQTFWRKLID